MVETVIDPVRMPSITLSQAEIEEIEQQMKAGVLPPDFLDRYYQAVENNVFGIDHKKDKDGNPIEQGRGSPGNQVRQSIDAYKKFHGPKSSDPDPDFEQNLKRMEAELAVCEERRNAAAAARRKRAGAGARR